MNVSYTPDRILVDAVKSMGPGMTIVDVGCADGRFIKLCREHALEISGCDTLDFLPEAARASYAQQLHESFPFSLIVNGKLPYPDASLDAVVCNQVIEHVKDKQSFFRELFRVLKPGGMLFAIFPTREAFIDPHVDLPFIHRADLSRPLHRFVCQFFVLVGFGSYPQWSQRFAWLDSVFDQYPLYHFFVSRGAIVNLIRDIEPGASITVADNEYFSAIARSRPTIARLAWIPGLSSLILRQAGMYLRVAKPLEK